MASGSPVLFVCEWMLQGEDDEETICGSSFTNHSLFTSHVQDHLASLPPSSLDDCPWNGCHFSSLDKSFYPSHILFHAYHSFLKVKGGEYRAEKELPECLIGKELVNVFPPSPEPVMTCRWERVEGVSCGQTFTNPALYYTHVKDHVLASSFEASHCKWSGCSFSTKSHWNLVDHMRTHTQEKSIACNGCGLLFSNATRLRDHLQRQATPSDHAHFCSICKKSYLTERLLKEHLRKHINTTKCPHCAMTCISPSSLLRHIMYRHSSNKPFVCGICQKSCKTKDSLSEHLTTHKEPSYSCSVPRCEFVSKSEKIFKLHMKTEHSGEKDQYCCHVCDGKRFSKGLELTKHLKTVHGFGLPPGHSRFRYVLGDDGLKRLQTVRLDKVTSNP